MNKGIQVRQILERHETVRLADVAAEVGCTRQRAQQVVADMMRRRGRDVFERRDLPGGFVTYRLRPEDELREHRKRQSRLETQRQLRLDLATLSTEMSKLVTLAENIRQRLDDLAA